jgi:hypothetical protein
MKSKTHLLLCGCSTPEHQLIFRYDPDDEPVEKALYISVHLGYWENFWRRWIMAVKYLFGYKSRYGEFDEIIVTVEEAKRLIAYLYGYVGPEVTITEVTK